MIKPRRHDGEPMHYVIDIADPDSPRRFGPYCSHDAARRDADNWNRQYGDTRPALVQPLQLSPPKELRIMTPGVPHDA